MEIVDGVGGVGEGGNEGSWVAFHLFDRLLHECIFSMVVLYNS